MTTHARLQFNASARPPQFPSTMQNKKLVDLMDKFRAQLGAQVNAFTAQAVKVDEWDRSLIKQRDRALQLHESTLRLKQACPLPSPHWAHGAFSFTLDGTSPGCGRSERGAGDHSAAPG